MKLLKSLAALVMFAPGLAHAQAQGLFDPPSAGGKLASVGWAGFLDTQSIINSLAALLLAIGLGATIGFHPKTPRTVDRLHEADMPKICVMYAFIGAVIGVTVREYGMVIGVVVFGIGGLFRFKTDTDSTRDTGRLIVVTLVGLIAGLGLPHFAVIATVFAFALIYVFDTTPVCRVKIEHLPIDRLGECADIHRAVLQVHGCKIIAEHKIAAKGRLEFVFRLPRKGTRASLHAALSDVPPETRGEIDWEVE